MWLTKLEQLADPKYGLKVRFVSGWKRRGASGGAQMHSVKGVLWHHTAGARRGNNPSRNILINGRPGLSGPLCHINFMRDGTVEIVGAGKANHAGKGIVRGVPRNAGNTRLIGIEMESAGTRPWDWTASQLREMPKLGAALNDIYGLGTSEHWGHKEYSSTGKIDPAGLPGGMAGLRSRIAATRVGGGSSAAPTPDTARPWRTSPRVAGMSTAEVRKVQQLVDVTADGIYGPQTGTAVRALQQQLGITADGVYGPGTEKAIMSLIEDIWSAQITLVGGKRTTMAMAVREAHAVAATNQAILKRILAQTGHVHRGGESIAMIQEVADIKTILLGQDLPEIIRDALAGVEGQDPDVLAAAVAERLADGLTLTVSATTDEDAAQLLDDTEG